MNKNWILASAITATLAACGGGGSSSGGGNSSPGTVSGGASKGIVIGGVVNAYAIADDGSVDKSSSVAEPATTADDGSYSLTLNRNYQGGALLIEITAEDGTTMRCDLAVCQRDSQGTPTVSFGDDYPLAADFSMQAMLPSASGTVSASITPLTSAAAALGLQKVAAGARAGDAAIAANAQVANKLGLASSDLLSQPIVDITNAESLNAAGKEALEYNVKAAAAIAAALADGRIEDALTAFANQYKSTGMADKEDGDPSVSVEELLEAAQELMDKVAAVDGADNEDIDALATEIDVEEGDAETNGSTTPSQGDVPDDVGSQGLQASKAFVKQLRNVGTAAFLEPEGEDGEALTGFAKQVGMASDVLSTDASAVVEAAAMGLNAISYAFEAVQDAKADEEPLPESFEQEGVTVAIAQVEGGIRYSVDQTINGAAVVLTALDDSEIDEQSTENSEFTPAEQEQAGEMKTARAVAIEGPQNGTTETTESGTSEITADMQLSGSASTDTVTFTIAEGSLFEGSLVGEWSGSETDTQSANGYQYDGQYTDEFTVTNLRAIINGSLETALEGEQTVTFSGGLELGVERFDSEYSEEWGDQSNWQEASGSGYDNSQSTVMVDGFELTLSGSIANNDGDAFNASLALQADGIHEVCTDEYSYSYSMDEPYQWDASYDCSLQESAEQYASAAIAVSFDIALDGVADFVKLTATGTRTGLEEADLDVELAYSGNTLTIAHTADLSEDAPEGGSVTVSNHNDVVMTLTEDADGELSGTIEQDGVKYADIDEDAGAPVITYTDGEFESF